MTEYREVQQIARDAMSLVMNTVRAGQPLPDVREQCEQAMRRLGADSFWYWDIGAFIFSGSDTVRSESGRTYETPDRVIQSDDVITIDLSPQRDGIWGDFARTIIIENGHALGDPREASRDDWRAGVLAEERLHNALLSLADPSMTFDELYRSMNALIVDLGFENLDFSGNLGHSIERARDDRVYIESGNNRRLGEVDLFTFEPHIRQPGDDYGFKHENIYFFEAGRLKEL